MAVMCQLADPAGYHPFSWNYADHSEDFLYWLNLFANFTTHIESQLRRDGLLNADNESDWREFCAEYDAGIAARRENPSRFGKIDTVTLGRFRQSLLQKFGFNDPYSVLKNYENDTAVNIYPDVIERIDRTSQSSRWELLFRGLFAGNIFDMGSPKTIAMYKRGQIDFVSALEKVPARPWFVDHLQAMCTVLESSKRWGQVLFFVDNAGPDIILGVVPLVRELARRGTRVVMAANCRPALNDITIEELNRVLQELCPCDPMMADLLNNRQITTIDSGGDIPLIDLCRVSEECNAAAAESDLIVLEGMGRGVESNWDQKFKCDVWRLALIKDLTVAKWLGAQLFDVICRFDPTE
ncbi:MAG: ARMT1-like domain-containing protein [Planctomycetota bacterium]|jgi:uncharacterized protein with ATP-grasp and redox domains